MKKTSKSSTPKNTDEYIDAQPENVRASLEQLRQNIKKAAPKAEEVISYQMPAFRFHGMLVYFAAFKNHCSFFVGNRSLIKTMKEELKSYKTSPTGTIYFTPEKPLTAALVKKIIKARMKENIDREQKRKERKNKK